MSPLFTFSSRQQALLKLLLQNPAGTSTDELTNLLGISRNATNQHLSSLGNLDLIQHDLRPSKGGRPIKNYRLSPRGQELFPRHYDLFARMLIEWIQRRLDENNLKQGLRDMGVELASHYRDRVDALGGLPLKISETATILTEMGYEADTSTTDDGASEIIARNCVFHRLAGQCKQVCELDLSLIGNLLNARIDHQECIVNGDPCCRFGITPE